MKNRSDRAPATPEFRATDLKRKQRRDGQKHPYAAENEAYPEASLNSPVTGGRRRCRAQNEARK